MQRYWAVRPGAAGTGTAGAVPAVSPLCEAIAEVSAHRAEALRPDRSLVDDLGFDSLMLVELEEQLSRRYPDLPGLPEELRRRTTTVGELERFLAGRRGEVVDGGRPAETFPEVAALAGRRTLPGRLGIPDPYFVAHDGPLGATTRVGGTVLVDFSGYDYLGLATHPSVIAGACEAMARYGTSVSASRVASGERPVHG
jgi:acyl carrier protein